MCQKLISGTVTETFYNLNSSIKKNVSAVKMRFSEVSQWRKLPSSN